MAKTTRAKRAQDNKKPTPRKKQAKKEAKKIKDVPSSFSLLGSTLGFFYQHKRKLLGVAAVFLVLYLVMVRSGSTFDLESTDQLISDELGTNELVNKAVLTGILLGSGGSSESGISSLSAFLLIVLGSLAFIWAIRRLEAGKTFRTRDAYYKGMYPLIPFILVVFLISLQMIPFVVGGFLYATAEVNGLISSLLERAVFVSAWVALGLLSVYWLANSLMGVYAVTLPDIYPLQALRSTKQIVKGRRWSIFLKMAMGAIVLGIVSSLILLLAVMALPAIAVYVYDVLLVLALLFTHIYLFKLYKSLI